MSVRYRKSIADAAERDTLLMGFARDARNSVRDRIRAIAELNKCTGKHLVSGTLTLEQVLTQSREPSR